MAFHESWQADPPMCCRAQYILVDPLHPLADLYKAEWGEGGEGGCGATEGQDIHLIPKLLVAAILWPTATASARTTTASPSTIRIQRPCTPPPLQLRARWVEVGLMHGIGARPRRHLLEAVGRAALRGSLKALLLLLLLLEVGAHGVCPDGLLLEALRPLLRWVPIPLLGYQRVPTLVTPHLKWWSRLPNGLGAHELALWGRPLGLLHECCWLLWQRLRLRLRRLRLRLRLLLGWLEEACHAWLLHLHRLLLNHALR